MTAPKPPKPPQAPEPPQAFDRRLDVTRPVLPSAQVYRRLLEPIWSNHILTNMGLLHQRLEKAVGDRIGVGTTSLWSSGTTALIGALSALDLEGSVIVTPFTFPATVHAIALLGLEPVFADIDEESLTLDPASVRERLTSHTSAVVATHVYGNFCDFDGLGSLARDAGARLVFDGAHAFGRRLPPGAASLGDVTMFSFHATKLFHTAEGGALSTPDPDLDRRFRLARNFGIADPGGDPGIGIGLNGKLSELHAALGLAVLDLVDTELERRTSLDEAYRVALRGIPGLRVVGDRGAGQYFVVRIDPAQFGSDRDALNATLGAMNVGCRRYFHPLCSDLPAYAQLPSTRDLPRARRAAAEVLALPLHGGLDHSDVARIAEMVRWHHQGGRACARADGRGPVTITMPRGVSVSATPRRPRVSVVMTSYNHEVWVAEAVGSVLAQTMPDFELVVVDDASRDATPEVVAGFQDARIRLHQLPQNRGGAAALNFAIEQASADLVAVINSDDAWEPLKLERQLALLDGFPEVGAVFTHAHLVGADGRPLAAESTPSAPDTFSQPNRSQAGWLRFFFDHGNALCHPSVLIRRRFYQEHGFYDNRLRQLPDFERWIALVKRWPILVLAQPLVRFRILPDGQNVSSASPRSIARAFHEHLEIAEGFFDDCPDQLLSEAFGDLLIEGALDNAEERACAVAHLWLRAVGPLQDVGRARAHRELRRLLGSRSTARLLAERYHFTDLDLHTLAGELGTLLPPTTRRWVEASAPVALACDAVGQVGARPQD